MKKLLLLFTFFVGFNSFAQLTCATATPILANGTIVSPAITGTYQAICWGTAATTPKATWYSYTATQNGEVNLNSDLLQNDGVLLSDDHRVSVATGTCALLACYAGQDDISGTNYRVNITFPVAAGTTYYIVWDNRWLSTAFDFNFTFTAVSCVRPSELSVTAPTNITANTATVNWTAAIGTPSGYDVEFGDLGFAQGGPFATIVNTASTTANLTGLTPNSNSEYYLRSNCGATQSGWTGPYELFLAKALPYTNGFEDPQLSDGFTSTTWALANAAGGAQAGTIYYASFSSTTAATTATLYSRAFALQANEQVTINYFTRLGSATATAQTLKLFVNSSASLTGATQIGTNLNITGTTYTAQSGVWSAPSTGIYYFAFNNDTPIVAVAASLRLDTVNITSVLSTNEFLSSKFSVYPNPSNNLITISNDVNALVNTIEVSDLNGRVVKSQKINATEGQVSIGDLSTGVYMMKIASDQGIAIKKIIKQ